MLIYISGDSCLFIVEWERGSAEHAPPYVYVVMETVFYQFNVFHVVFDDAYQVT